MVASARTAVVSPATCERPPARSTVAVLDRLPATPNPPKMPELTLPTPTASRSWLASTRASSVAYSRAALSPSARPTKATAAPATSTWPQSDRSIPGSDGVGSPWGTVADDLHAVGREVQDVRGDQPDHQRDQRPGHLAGPACVPPNMSGQRDDAHGDGLRLDVVQARDQVL